MSDSIINKINNEFISAMKSGDKLVKNTMTSIKAVIKNAEIDKKKNLIDSEVINLIRKEIKKREDSYLAFCKAGRKDLSDIEQMEINVLAKYIPAQIAIEVVASAIQEVIKTIGATSKKDMGKVIKLVGEKFNGAVDNKTISQEVNKVLK